MDTLTSIKNVGSTCEKLTLSFTNLTMKIWIKLFHLIVLKELTPENFLKVYWMKLKLKKKKLKNFKEKIELIEKLQVREELLVEQKSYTSRNDMKNFNKKIMNIDKHFK